MKLFLSPHDDDQVLFGAFTLMREKPLVVIVTDSWIQPSRGEIGCDAKTRAKESEEANSFLGVATVRLGIRDDKATMFDISEALSRFKGFDEVYVPAMQGGNIHHDMVSLAAQGYFTKITFYTTYTKTALYTTGSKEIIPMQHEIDRKILAMRMFKSQANLPATLPHFEAVVGKSEWYL